MSTDGPSLNPSSYHPSDSSYIPADSEKESETLMKILREAKPIISTSEQRYASVIQKTAEDLKRTEVPSTSKIEVNREEILQHLESDNSFKNQTFSWKRAFQYNLKTLSIQETITLPITFIYVLLKTVYERLSTREQFTYTKEFALEKIEAAHATLENNIQDPQYKKIIDQKFNDLKAKISKSDEINETVLHQQFDELYLNISTSITNLEFKELNINKLKELIISVLNNRQVPPTNWNPRTVLISRDETNKIHSSYKNYIESLSYYNQFKDVLDKHVKTIHTILTYSGTKYNEIGEYFLIEPELIKEFYTLNIVLNKLTQQENPASLSLLKVEGIFEKIKSSFRPTTPFPVSYLPNKIERALKTINSSRILNFRKITPFIETALSRIEIIQINAESIVKKLTEIFDKAAEDEITELDNKQKVLDTFLSKTESLTEERSIKNSLNELQELMAQPANERRPTKEQLDDLFVLRNVEDKKRAETLFKKKLDNFSYNLAESETGPLLLNQIESSVNEFMIFFNSVKQIQELPSSGQIKTQQMSLLDFIKSEFKKNDLSFTSQEIEEMIEKLNIKNLNDAKDKVAILIKIVPSDKELVLPCINANTAADFDELLPRVKKSIIGRIQKNLTDELNLKKAEIEKIKSAINSISQLNVNERSEEEQTAIKSTTLNFRNIITDFILILQHYNNHKKIDHLSNEIEMHIEQLYKRLEESKVSQNWNGEIYEILLRVLLLKTEALKEDITNNNQDFYKNFGEITKEFVEIEKNPNYATPALSLIPPSYQVISDFINDL